MYKVPSTGSIQWSTQEMMVGAVFTVVASADGNAKETETGDVGSLCRPLQGRQRQNLKARTDSTS